METQQNNKLLEYLVQINKNLTFILKDSDKLFAKIELLEQESEKHKDIDKDKWFLIGLVVGAVLASVISILISLIK